MMFSTLRKVGIALAVAAMAYIPMWVGAQGVSTKIWLIAVDFQKADAAPQHLFYTYRKFDTKQACEDFLKAGKSNDTDADELFAKSLITLDRMAGGALITFSCEAKDQEPVVVPSKPPADVKMSVEDGGTTMQEQTWLAKVYVYNHDQTVQIKAYTAGIDGKAITFESKAKCGEYLKTDATITGAIGELKVSVEEIDPTFVVVPMCELAPVGV
jgi:hypothetical protein